MLHVRRQCCRRTIHHELQNVNGLAGKFAGGNGKRCFASWMVCRSHLHRVPVDLIRDQLDAERFGFRFGEKGTHTSRTMMLADLAAALGVTEPRVQRADYAAAIVEHNCLGKDTVATRRLANQRLGELYALDPTVPLFRVLRRLWPLEEQGKPLLALLAAVARDPLLAASTEAILELRPGTSLDRDRLTAVLRKLTGERLNQATLDKVVRNVASSWEQAGHLEGRTFKKRRSVQPTVGAFVFALFLGYAAGFRGSELLNTVWVRLLDCSASRALALAQEAKRIGLIDFRMAGDVVAISLEGLDSSLRVSRV